MAVLVSQALGIEPGVVACIGGGGKTSLVLRLAQELRQKGRVIVCATAKMHLPEGLPLIAPDVQLIEQAFKTHNPICVGERSPEGKLTLGLGHIRMLRSLVPYVIIEADGSKGLPLKAHAPHEPVIPEEADRVILVIGVDGIGKPVKEAAHRHELYAAYLGVDEEHIITAQDVARVILKEGLQDTVFINKVETETQMQLAKELAAYVGCPAVAGALRFSEGEVCLLS